MDSLKIKKGLGRGLSSLIGDTKVNSNITKLPISSLVRNKLQPRKIFDKDNLQDLTNSIKERGIIQPIIVRKSTENTKIYEIIAGERRWMAAQKAGLHEVPVIVLDLNDIQSLELAIIENIQREDLSAIEEAKGFQRLIDEFKYDHEKLSEFMGKSRSHISNTIRLLSLPEDVLIMVEQGKLTAGQVRPLVGRFNALDIAKSIIKEKLSARSIENLVKKEKEKEQTRLKPRKQTDPNLLLAQRKIEESLGLNVKIVARKHNTGKVIVEYNNLEQFEMLSKLLKSD